VATVVKIADAAQPVVGASSAAAVDVDDVEAAWS